MIAQIKHPGGLDGEGGTLELQRKAEAWPEVPNTGSTGSRSATEVTETPNDSFTPQKQNNISWRQGWLEEIAALMQMTEMVLAAV